MSSNCRIAKSLQDLKAFLADTAKKSRHELSQIKFSEQNEWDLENGSISHKCRGFFHVSGLRNRQTSEECIILFQPQNGLTGLAICRHKEALYVLLQARIEPGDLGQYGPTVQATPANYLALHGGKATAYIDIFTSFNHYVRLIEQSMQLDLGKRYFQKSKSHIYVELDELIETEQNMIWVPLEVAYEATSRSNFLNADLRSLLAIFDWDSFLMHPDCLSFSGGAGKIVSDLIARKHTGYQPWDLVSIASLKKWSVTDEGVDNIADSGLSVNMYRVKSRVREVASWAQPLMKADNQGLVVLLVRDDSGEKKFLLTLQREFGVSGGLVILPSYTVYPGDKYIDIVLPEKSLLVSEIIQSDEGARFIDYESIYRIFQVFGEVKHNDNQYWVTACELKKILNTSNMVSLQLRCIASLIMDALNPYSFS